MLRVALIFALLLLGFAPQAAARAQSPERASCKTPFVDAGLTLLAPATPSTIALEQRAAGTTLVEFRLSAAGKVTDQKVAVSSGNRWLDRAALESVAASHFSAEVRDCKAVGGTYLLRVDFPE